MPEDLLTGQDLLTGRDQMAGRDRLTERERDAARFEPHLEAIRASVRAGFRFRHLPSHSRMLALHGFRTRAGVMDMYLARDAHDAFAARVRLEDLELPRTPRPLWHGSGPVAEVVHALLEIPEHGSRGAPVRPVDPPSDLLWVPGRP